MPFDNLETLQEFSHHTIQIADESIQYYWEQVSSWLVDEK